MQLIVITGPTGSGKTDLAIEVARHFDCDIVNADSRQIYRHIPIGTAAPTPAQLAAVKHHFVAALELDQYYSAAQYRDDVMTLIPTLKTDTLVMCGGSMMYIDAVTRGIDELPTISPEVRARVLDIYNNEGLPAVRSLLQSLDPEYYKQVDLNNPRRIIHAIEICLESGRPYSSLRTGSVTPPPFPVKIFTIDYPREQLFDRINRRVDAMLAAGLVDEARSVSHLRHLNSLNTVGFKEMFRYLDGEWDLPTATARMAKNTRVYAKKQLTWLQRRPDIIHLTPEQPLLPQLLSIIEKREERREKR